MKLQFVEYRDHFTNGDEWTPIDQYVKEKYRPAICRSVGWVVREDRQHIAMVANLNGNPETETDINAFGAFVILKACIVRRVTLKGV